MTSGARIVIESASESVDQDKPYFTVSLFTFMLRSTRLAPGVDANRRVEV